MERNYIGKCPKCGMEIYSENGMATRFCTHCGTALGTNYGGMAVAYMEKEETAEQKTAQAEPFKADSSIPGFDVSSSAGLYSFKQEEINAKKRRNAAMFAGGIAAVVISVAALGFTTFVGKTSYPEPTVVTTNEPEPTQEEPVTEEPVTEEPETETKTVATKPAPTSIDQLSDKEKEAVRKAERFLDSIPYSKAELIEELQDEYYGFTEEEATNAVGYMENAGLVNFYDEAAKWAKSLSESTSFSRAELIRMLSGEYSSHYTKEEAEYAVKYVEDNGLVDWNEMAKKEAEIYTSFSYKYTREELISQLMDGNDFTQSEAEYAADALGF
ncbi:Ltp family lipoprotein [Butyrivibrio sp. AE3004]|uniref:Ltp family lipoprotein n=1 Tax=Butyrivibrio sp. AE3004 TaxID=1506994 RepID=UPI000494C795|nr:Ltp family lipoprotein [Butyrivibrio sp. AE3004]